ncbi:MAG: nitrous oxide-stimulated promoter family protein [Candidatus Galacturonibacter soehngenii]|nr:nitrous oxide-stimulated promoter family protein [Candidatus Galacturonibacter soehngenii]
MKINEKVEQEISVVEKMIEIYCNQHKHAKKGLCKDCEEILTYAKGQINRCPHMKDKTFCSTCKTHCYKPVMREKIRIIMRYSGPRLLMYHPILTIKHGLNTWNQKKANKF